MVLEIRGLSFAYNHKPVLRSIDFEFRGGLLTLVGPNGSGKSTLLKCINQVLRSQGTVVLDGSKLAHMDIGSLSRLLGYVPQYSPKAFPMTVFDSVLLGRRSRFGWKPRKEDIEQVAKIIESLGLQDFILRNINELSGGERQKVMIARALAQEPRMMLLDEPTSALDIKHQLEVLNLIRKKVDEGELMAIMALHDLNLASRYSDMVILMKEGEITGYGPPSSVITRDNIERVYDVEVLVEDKNGKPHVVPLHPNPSNFP